MEYFVANEHELSYNDDDLAAFLPTDSVDMNRSYNDEELEELLSQGSTRDSFIDTERFREYDVDHSYTEEEFDSLCSSYYSQTDSVLTSETSFSTQFDCSTPLKPVRQMDSSFSEEEWKSFLEHTSNEDEEMRPFPDDSDIDIDIDESYSDSDNFMSIDPEFYSNVFAVPKSSVVSKGKSIFLNIS